MKLGAPMIPKLVTRRQTLVLSECEREGKKVGGRMNVSYVKISVDVTKYTYMLTSGTGSLKIAPHSWIIYLTGSMPIMRAKPVTT